MIKMSRNIIVLVKEMSVYSSKSVFALIVVCVTLGVVIVEIIRSGPGDILASLISHDGIKVNLKPLALIVVGISLAIIAYVIDTIGR